MSRLPFALFTIAVTFAAILSAQSSPQRISGQSPFSKCAVPGITNEVNYLNTAVEPFVAVNPGDSTNLLAVWEQDRWTYGGARGLLAVASHNQGKTWSYSVAPLSICTGGTAANGGNYERATDPWLTFSANGTAYQSSISFDAVRDANEAILVSRSTDGGNTWSAPATLLSDTAPTVVYDKDSLAADVTNPELIYAVWDRLVCSNHACSSISAGPSWFSRSATAGASWEAARVLYDPGTGAQTYANRLAVLPDSTLLNLFVVLNKSIASPGDVVVDIMRSTDQGVTWSAPTSINTLQSIGIRDGKLNLPIRTGDLIPSIAVDRSTGVVYVAWEDARFSGGQRDGILFAKSTDGGLTWTAPVQVNQAPSVQAFSASIAAANGSIAINYYDFRNDNTNVNALLTNYWQVISQDGGQTWTESGLGGPFNMLYAPLVTRDISLPGLFLGDYQGLASNGAEFLSFFAMATTNLSNRTDVFLTDNTGTPDVTGQ